MTPILVQKSAFMVSFLGITEEVEGEYGSPLVAQACIIPKTVIIITDK